MSVSDEIAPHPGENHNFETKCTKCGEYAYLNVAFITDNEVVRIEERHEHEWIDPLFTDSPTGEVCSICGILAP